MSQQINLVVFIDYDNLTSTQKTAGILDVIAKALIQLQYEAEIARAICDVRVYGGWYEGTEITRLAQEVVVEIQNNFPTIINIPSNNKYIQVKINSELAVALMKEPGHHLFNTLRRREKPGNIRIESPDNIGCVDSGCVIPLMKKFLNKGKCPKPDCNVPDGNLIYRQEQKLVDTMLTCDLIHAASEEYYNVILISSDDDFLPPLRTIALEGAEVIRFHPKRNRQRAIFPHSGTQLLELDL